MREPLAQGAEERQPPAPELQSPTPERLLVGSEGRHVAEVAQQIREPLPQPAAATGLGRVLLSPASPKPPLLLAGRITPDPLDEIHGVLPGTAPRALPLARGDDVGLAMEMSARTWLNMTAAAVKSGRSVVVSSTCKRLPNRLVAWPLKAALAADPPASRPCSNPVS
jgi:hypothetical protein